MISSADLALKDSPVELGKIDMAEREHEPDSDKPTIHRRVIIQYPLLHRMR